MLFLVAFGVPEKSVFTRFFCVFATCVLANFQDRLVMTASQHSPTGEITLHKDDAHAASLLRNLKGGGSALAESTSQHSPLGEITIHNMMQQYVRYILS